MLCLVTQGHLRGRLRPQVVMESSESQLGCSLGREGPRSRGRGSEWEEGVPGGGAFEGCAVVSYSLFCF